MWLTCINTETVTSVFVVVRSHLNKIPSSQSHSIHIYRLIVIWLMLRSSFNRTLTLSLVQYVAIPAELWAPWASCFACSNFEVQALWIYKWTSYIMFSEQHCLPFAPHLCMVWHSIITQWRPHIYAPTTPPETQASCVPPWRVGVYNLVSGKSIYGLLSLTLLWAEDISPWDSRN